MGAMTDDEINIAIAKTTGDIIIKGDWTTEEIIQCGAIRDIKRYCNDLNAMHEAKQALWKMDWDYRYIFNDHLANIIKGRIVNRNEWDAETLLDATAEQQAESFLRTLNLWVE